mmetsp:Transcript_4067/g.9682  ORF Transcript_4067/g.9682 Transcript_4067/m.9682 type:complete len:99 (-) Transcript_4067:373-669(-)
MKYLATKLTVKQEARYQGKIKTEKASEICHPPGSLTKPLQGKEFVFKGGRLLRRRPGRRASAPDARPRVRPPWTWDRALTELPARGARLGPPQARAIG